MENKHTTGELRQMQSLSLQSKIQMTCLRIRGWVDEFGEENVYLAFSGGKDSTVLKHIIKQIYPRIKSVFCNTGLEHPSVMRFALSQENVTEIRPEMNFRDVIIKYGYPMIGKRQARFIHDLQTAGEHNKATVKLRLTGLTRNGVYCSSMKLPKKYLFMKDAPFSVSQECCNVMKKNPIAKSEYGKQYPFMATMAEESELREKKWKQYGCNMFDLKHPQSAPMSFWTEQDVLSYIHTYNLTIADAYGQVVVKDDCIDGQINIHDYLGDYRDCQYETTGENRTGCIFCGFGIVRDKDRFIRLAKQEPKLCDYVMRGGEFSYKVFDRKGKEIKLKHCAHKQIEKWCVDNSDNKSFKIESTWQPSKDGLGYWFVLEWMNVHGNLGIGIPNRDHYIKTYGNDKTTTLLSQQVGLSQ